MAAIVASYILALTQELIKFRKRSIANFLLMKITHIVASFVLIFNPKTFPLIPSTMSRMKDILAKLDLFNQHHLSTLLLFSYLSIPLHIAQRLCFISSLHLGYEVWNLAILISAVVGMSYSGILDQVTVPVKFIIPRSFFSF